MVAVDLRNYNKEREQLVSTFLSFPEDSSTTSIESHEHKKRLLDHGLL
jgi:hypothetical protein